ncbi:MAG: serine hydrolase domain-containing protein [Planctomycetota bacterium]
MFCSPSNILAFGISVLFSLSSTSASLATDSELTTAQQTQIDDTFAMWGQDDSPGVAVGVVRNGKLIFSKGYGLADLEHDVPIDASTVFYMASVSKHFVTFCILLLEEQGKLDLDDEIQKFLPDFPKYESPLTIRHFIHHTSGVRDSLTLWRLAGNDYLDYIHDDAIYDLIKQQKALNFPPGEKYLYSNSCYFMLAKIVEKASGSTIRKFAEKHIFRPLGMKNTHFHDDVNQIIKNRAFSYQANWWKDYRNIIMRFDLVGSGGLYSTIEDMALWDQNFNQNRLGKGGPDLIAKMLTEGKLNSGESCNYACGLQNRIYRGLTTIEHGGALAGYRTYFLRFPDQKTSITILANVDNVNAGKKAKQVADIVLAESFSAVTPGVQSKSKKDQNSKSAKPKNEISQSWKRQ